MSVRVGKVELRAVQSLRSEEARALIEQRAPGQAGAVFQDLGRGPTTLHVEGLLLGEEALDAMEVLRSAQAKAEPLSFAADIATGTEITEVLVEDFRCTQTAGAVNRYLFTLRLREHVEPPSPLDAGVPAVEAGVFGAPSYVLDGEVFWGQDRLDLLDAALASGRAPYLAEGAV